MPFVKARTGIEPAALCVSDLDAPAVLAFLDHLEQERGNSVRSRNIRLSAIRSLLRFITFRDPDSVGVATRIMAIPRKREDKKLVGYLTRNEMEALLAAPDRTQWAGRRDHALLLTMYNSGARVSELASLQRNQVQLGSSTFLMLHGKGRKERTVPLWPNTARVLRAWLQEPRRTPAEIAFPNARGVALSRDETGSSESGRVFFELGYKAHLATCHPAHHWRSSPSIGSGHRGDRPLARPREHRNGAHLR